MAGFVETATRTFTAGAAIAQYLRVKLSSGKLAVCEDSDVALGQTEAASFADLDVVPVRLRNAQGTHKMVAAGAFAVGATLHGADGGKVDDVDTSNPIGTALEAATADGDIVEVLPFAN